MNEEENNKKKIIRNYVNKNPEVVNIKFFKKVWYSITKFEKYPEMATEGVGRAIWYLIQFMFIFAIIISAVMVYKFAGVINAGTNYINDNFEVLSYENGNLDVKIKNNDNKMTSDMGTLIIDTSDLDSKDIENYKKDISTNKMGIIWLKDKVIFKLQDIQEEYYYKDILDEFGITSFDKTDLIEYVQTNKTSTYIAYFIAIVIYTFILYFIAQIMNAILLSIFGVITSWIAGMKIRYRAIFNMSIYAITLSTILQLIYIIVNYFIDFNIKYFDLMYTAIAYICLAAAIFMIKSDVIKQQIELIKIVDKKEEKKQEEDKEQNKDDERKEEKEKKDEKREEKKDKSDDKEKKENLGGQVEGEGSNA